MDELNPDLLALNNLFAYIIDFDNHSNTVAIDKAHNIFLLGALLSKKPKSLLEVGLGSGYTLHTMIQGIRHNLVGELTIVENWYDWGGIRQENIFNDLTEKVTDLKITFLEQAERVFLDECKSDQYDFILTDADHKNGGYLIDEYLRIAKEDAFIFMHDTNYHHTGQKCMKYLEERLIELKLPHFMFTESTRPNERCEEGFTFIINRRMK